MEAELLLDGSALSEAAALLELAVAGEAVELLAVDDKACRSLASFVAAV